METNEDKQLESLIGKLLKDSALESPSEDFTSKIMAHALLSQKHEVYTYKPPISRTAFVLISGFLIALFFGGAKDSKPQMTNWLTGLDFNSHLAFHFSRIAVYAVVLATLMLLIQVYFLQKQFYKHLK